jgi:hypothetical protein
MKYTVSKVIYKISRKIVIYSPKACTIIKHDQWTSSTGPDPEPTEFSPFPHLRLLITTPYSVTSQVSQNSSPQLKNEDNAHILLIENIF